jgi:hypothetical protein
MTTTDNPLARLSAACLALGGILGAAFVIVSRGEIVGAMAMLSTRWIVAHNLHFASATLLLVGVAGLYVSHESRLGVAGQFAFILALLGTAAYFAGGVITAGLLPSIAAASPGVVSAGGPLFSPTLPALVVMVGLFQVGWIALGIVVARAGVVPRWAGFTTAAGAALGLIPPRPFGKSPWILMDVAWVVFAVGLTGISRARTAAGAGMESR